MKKYIPNKGDRAAVYIIDNWDGERNRRYTFAEWDGQDWMETEDMEKMKPLLEYKGDKILKLWPLSEESTYEVNEEPEFESIYDFWEWEKENRDEHRKEFNDVEWAQQQPKGPPKYKIGDVLKFKVGGYGVIDDVCHPEGGWPSSYSTTTPEGMAGHPNGISAWHYEGDFGEWIGKSPLHTINIS